MTFAAPVHTSLANEVNHRHDGAPVRREGGDYRGLRDKGDTV